MAIIRAKTKLRCIDLPEDVVSLLASRIDSNVRELEGALAKLHLLSQTGNGPINAKLAAEACGAETSQTVVGIQDILNLVTKRHNVKLSDLQGKRRTKSIAFPLQFCRAKAVG